MDNLTDTQTNTNRIPTSVVDDLKKYFVFCIMLLLPIVSPGSIYCVVAQNTLRTSFLMNDLQHDDCSAANKCLRQIKIPI